MRSPGACGRQGRARCAPPACVVVVAVVALSVGALLFGGACATDRTGPVHAARSPATALLLDVTPLPDGVGRAGGLSLRYCLPAVAPRGPSREAAPRWPHRLAPELRKGLRYLVSAEDDDGAALLVDSDGVRVETARGCVRLVLDLGRMADELAHKDLALRVGDDVIATPDLWLWHASQDDRPADGVEILLRQVPSEINALLPWSAMKDGRLMVTAATWALKSDAAFGRFDIEVVDTAGARFRVARLDDGRAPARLSSWLASSAHAVALMDGRYPLAQVNVLVLPSPGTAPVLAGFFSRGGGATAVFFVGDDDSNPGVADEDINGTGRWAITHELAHALLPPVNPRDAWFNEGLTTWYQEVLARRAGMIDDDARFWHELLRGLDVGSERAAENGMSLEEASARMHETGAYQHAYWGGVAIMLLAEVEAQAHGASLDDLTLALRRSFAEDRPRLADELLFALHGPEGDDGDDAARVAARALRETWQSHRRAPFPDVTAALEHLGVRRDARGLVLLDDDASAAALRRAITRGRSDAAVGLGAPLRR